MFNYTYFTDYYNSPITQWIKDKTNYVQRFNVVGHSKELLSITLPEPNTIRVTSIKDTLPEYVPLIDFDIRLPTTPVQEIKANVENGVLTLTLITQEPKQIQIT